MATSEASTGGSDRRSIREGLVVGDLSNMDRVSLAGSKCSKCGETALGTVSTCPNCGGGEMKSLPLSKEGVLWTYTVVRHKPPGDYLGPDPFVPFAMGLVELPEKIRVLATLECSIDDVKVGMPLKLRPYVCVDKQARDVVAFTFEPKDKDEKK